MSDVIGKFFVIVLGAVMLFFVPVTIISLKQDNTSQNYINDAVTEFVDDARVTGKISPRAYENFVSKIYAVHPCTIKMYHGSRYLQPDPDKENTYTYETETWTTQDILCAMYPDENTAIDYELKDGDYFKVLVYNEEPTLGARMISLVVPSYTMQSLYESYGGFVGNNMQQE